ALAGANAGYRMRGCGHRLGARGHRQGQLCRALRWVDKGQSRAGLGDVREAWA
ncbi:unnamed protein product, partial [Ilex paraguariensis]